MYFKKTVECSNGMTFVTKYTGREQTGKKRAARSEETSLKKKLYNIRKSIENLYHLLLCNFFPKDYNLVLTYPQNERMTVTQAKATVVEFLSRYRKYCKANNYKPDYIYNTEIGGRGAIHHHIILHSHKDLEDIMELWEQASGGKVQCKGNWLLWDNYDWHGLAEYLIDRTKGGKLPDTHIPGERRYIPSKGLKKPKVTTERIEAKRWGKPRAIKGYELIKDSIRTGTDELTGGAYMKYSMRRII